MSDAEWDKDDYEPPTLVKKPLFADKWDGEDEDDIKDNWDDEDSKENDVPEGEIRASQPKKKKTTAQIIAEREEKRRLEIEEKIRLAEEANKVLSPEEKLAEKLRQQKLQEESDLELAKEAFGITDTELASKEDLDEFKNALVNKILLQQKSSHFVTFLDDLFRELVINLEATDIKKLSATLTAVAIEKGKKSAKAKPKKKKAALNIGKGNTGDLDMNAFDNEYDDFI